MSKDDVNNIDERKLKNMLIKIIGLEKQNLKNKKYSKNEMINQIMKIIEEEAKCY